MVPFTIGVPDHCVFKEGDWFEYRDVGPDNTVHVWRAEFTGYLVTLGSPHTVQIMYDSGDYYEHHSFVDPANVIGKWEKP